MSGGEQDQPIVDWQSWLHRWDAMQTAYIPDREARFQAMFDLLQARAEEAAFPESLVVVDLACGPGAISGRLLERFPRARCVGVDFDPALLALGQGALGDLEGRLRWVEADLRDPGTVPAEWRRPNRRICFQASSVLSGDKPCRCR